MRRWLNILLLCFALNALGTATASPSQIAITHITIIDVRAGTIKPDMTILIEGDRITAVRPTKSKEDLPANEIQVIDGHGKFVVPGLWDMHVHSDGEDRVLHLLLANGITGIRDMGGEIAKLADARRRITSGELMAPHFVFAGPLLKGASSEADDWAWIIHSPEEVQHAVERLAELHVDFVKVHDGLAREDFLAIAAASKKKGLSFAGHVPASMTPAEASDLGQKGIEHFEFVPKACHALFESPPPQLRGMCLPAATSNLWTRSCSASPATGRGSTPQFRVFGTLLPTSGARSSQNSGNLFFLSGRIMCRFLPAQIRSLFLKTRAIHPA